MNTKLFLHVIIFVYLLAEAVSWDEWWSYEGFSGKKKKQNLSSFEAIKRNVSKSWIFLV